VNITVWAPAAKSVELVTPERRIALHPGTGDWGETPPGYAGAVGAALSGASDPGAAVSTCPAGSGCADGPGHWHTEVDESVLAQGYRYSIDGGEPVPDPRSMWQPDGVHGASHLVGILGGRDHATRFVAKPLHDAVIYELHVGTFTPEGTYAAAQAKLPHLVRLGVTHVELMPLATFPGGRGWGYDGVDLYAPFPAYGSPQQLAAFVLACHAQGIGVLLDVVYNHLGPDGNYLAQYGPYFTDRYRTGWGAAINYDGPQSDPVRRFVIDNALMWLRDYGFDGLRLDAVHAIFSFDAVHVLEELASAVRALGAELGRSFVLIAESDLNDPRVVRPVSQGGYGLDAHWADDFHHAIHRFFTGETDGYYADFSGLEDLAVALRDGYVYQGRYSPHRGRRHGRPPEGVATHQLVVCAQNHDQVGNRAQGERLSMLLEVPQLKAIAALTVLSPFVPLLFQGEEWGAQTPFLYFTDHENAELGRLVAEGRSREFSSFRWQGAVPNPQELDTFLRSKLDWSELSEARHAEMYEWYRELIHFRHQQRSRAKVAASDQTMAAANGRSKAVASSRTTAVADGRARAAVKVDAAAGWLSFVHDDVLCVFNFAETPQRVPIPRGEWDLVLRSDGKEAALAGEVPAHTSLIFRRRG
jgi:maltooligosyltrehalose trehalohydrolase